MVFDLANLKIIEPKTTKVENFATLQLEDININKQVTRIVLLDANNQVVYTQTLGIGPEIFSTEITPTVTSGKWTCTLTNNNLSTGTLYLKLSQNK